MSRMRWDRRTLGPILRAWFAVGILFAVVSAYSPGFAAPAHVATLIIGASFIGIVAIGQTMVIVGGGIDLSIPWTLTGAAMLVTSLTRSNDGALLWAVPLVLCFGALVGTINGVGIARFRIPPIVMTLAMDVVLQGLLLVVTRGFPPPPSPAALQWLANGRIGVFPVMLAVWLVLAVAVLVVERLTAFGRHLYAMGSDRTVATLSGVPVRRTTIIAYAISGTTAALAGILLAGYAKQSYLGMGDPFLFTSIAAVAVGGASILGGSGSYLGSIAGALLLTVLTGLLPILRLPEGALRVVYGLVILGTVALAAPQVQTLMSRSRGRGKSSGAATTGSGTR
jgi:ribose transport system permease protein